NVVSDASVTFKVSEGAVITAVIGTTGADGKATAEVTSLTAGSYTVTATVNGKDTAKDTTFTADGATAEITEANLTINPNNAPANGTDKNGVTAIVTDANGNVVPGAVVSFAVTDGATINAVIGTTGEDGKATAEVTSTIAGTYTVTATVNGKDTSKDTTFIADKNTAEITDANLTIAPDGAVADGSAKNGVTAVVTDANGNLVSDAIVMFTVTEGAAITTITGTTGADGKAIAEVTSTTAGTYTVTASVNNTNTSANTRFVADKTTARIELVQLGEQSSHVVGSRANFTATAMDANGNLIQDADFDVKATGSDSVQADILNISSGIATLFISDTQAGTVNLAVNLKEDASVKANSDVVFVADTTTAEITEANLTINPNNAIADGVAKNGVTATVTDNFGNLVENADVAFSVADGAVISVITGTTGADGKATAEITSTTAGTYTVTAKVNGKETEKDTTFVADGDSAHIADADLSIDPDKSVANGAAKNGVTAIVTDSNGNVVPGASVAFTVSEGAEITTVIGTTGADGKATAEVTSLTAGTYTVTATVNGKETAKDTTFIADRTTAEITDANLVIDPDGAVADGSAKNGVTAVVTDANGNLVPSMDVTFAVTEGATITTVIGTTGADGKATAEVTSLKADAYIVTASVNGKNTQSTTRFVADKATAHIVLERQNDKDSYVVGELVNYTATMLDANDNVLVDEMLNAQGLNSADGIVIGGEASGKGRITFTATTTKAGTPTVWAGQRDVLNGNDIAATDTPTFVADKETAQIIDANINVYRNGSPADGKDTNYVGVVVTDAYGNVVSGIEVDAAVSEGATIVRLSNEGVTSPAGALDIVVSSLKADTYKVTATVNGKEASADIYFVADVSTAMVTDENLTIEPDGAVADGKEKNGARAVVTDANGNIVEGVAVTFSVTGDAEIQTVQGVSDENGLATAEITSLKSGTYEVRAVAAGSANFARKNTHFIADHSTARMVLTAVNPLDAHPAGSKANFTASVQDANGNVFKDAEIEVSASGTETTEAEITGVSNGVASLYVTDTKVGDVSFTVKQKGNESVNAAETVKFIADVASARVLDSDFNTPKANAIANGEDEVVITALVTDQYGNPVDVAATQSAGKATVTIAFGVNQSPIITQKSSYTYEGNKVTRRTSQDNFASIPTYPIVNGIEQSIEKKTINFIPVLTALTSVTDGAPANGSTPNEVEVRVMYGLVNNASGVTGAVVNLSADNDAVISSTVSTSNGGARAELTNTIPGVSTVTATYVQNGITQQLTLDTNFTNAATITDNDLVINPDNAVANGTDKNKVTATVTDGNGTPAAGEEVTFSVESGPELTVISGTSDADGKAVAELTSTVAGSFKVTASVNGNAVSKNATFVADASTAAIELTRTNVQETYVAGTRIGYTAVAKDANGNTITDAEFDVKAEGGTAASASITSTNNGVAVLSLYDTRAGETKLTVSLANNAEVDADDTVTYVPDESSSKISNYTVVKNYALAGLLEDNILTFNATDRFGNPLLNASTNAFEILVGQNQGYASTFTLNKLDEGFFEIRLKGTRYGSYSVRVRYGEVAGSSETQFVIFSGILAPLTIEENNAPSNGQSKNLVKGRIYDGLEGPAGSTGPKNIKLNFKADNGAILTAVPGSDIYSGNGSSSLTIWSDSSGYASVEVTNTTPGSTNITMTEVTHSTSQSEYTTVNFEPVIELKDQNVVIDPDNAPADGVSKNVVTATVTNQNGSPVAGAEVSFEVEAGPAISVVNGTTGADGKAVAELTSLQKGVFNVTVKVNDSEVTKPVTFISDAVIKDENMIVDPDGAISNSLFRNRVTAIVTDSAGNPLSGETVVFTVEEEPKLNLYPLITTTGDDGKAVAELSSGQFGTFNVTATVNGKSTTKPTTFVQWGIAVVEANIIKNNAMADEEDANEIEAKVEDGNFNPVAGAKVTFWVEGNSNARPITFVENEVLTDENGYARTKIKANRPGSYQIVANAYDYGNAGESAWFTFVTSGLNTDKSALKVTPPVIKADNNESATIELKVRDKFDTAITGQDVSFVIEKEDGTLPAEGAITLSAVIEGDPVILDESGYYTATLKGATPGRYKITPVVEGNRVGLSEVIELTSTAQILQSGLTLELDGSVADGEAKNIVTATVTDFAGNPVSGETVVFTGDDGIVITTVTGTTGADGKALAELTSISAGTFNVRASVNGSTAHIETNFVAGLAVGDGHSTMDINIPRIIANGGGKVDGEDVARVTFVAKDAFDNAVTGLVNAGALSFVAKDESQNVISDSQQIHFNNVTETQEGIYIADVQGKYVGKVTIHPVIQQGTVEAYAPDVNSAITLFDYSFKVNSDKLKIIVGGTSGFYIHATSSDNVDSNILLPDSTSLTYVSSNTAVITVNSNGDATGVGVGEALISATGEYNGLSLGESNTSGVLASVKQPVTYGPFGDSGNSQARHELFIVREEDNYSLFARGGSIVDAIGVSDTHKIGGNGGGEFILTNLNKVSRITTCTTPDIYEEGNASLREGISQIRIEYRNGQATDVIGDNGPGIVSDCSHVVDVPEGYSLDGFDVRGNVYIHSVGYILNPDGFE
ncbi:Ig-like domain-containing protein, partial [Enterobacter cloacae]